MLCPGEVTKFAGIYCYFFRFLEFFDGPCGLHESFYSFCTEVHYSEFVSLFVGDVFFFFLCLFVLPLLSLLLPATCLVEAVFYHPLCLFTGWSSCRLINGSLQLLKEKKRNKKVRSACRYHPDISTDMWNTQHVDKIIAFFQRCIFWCTGWLLGKRLIPLSLTWTPNYLWWDYMMITFYINTKKLNIQKV